MLTAFAVIDDFIRTLASDLTYRVELQWAFRAALIWFSSAFVGAYFAQNRVELIAVVLVTTFWILNAPYRYATALWIENISFIQFVSEGLPTIVPSILFCYLGAILGRKYYIGSENPNTKLTQIERTAILATVVLLILVVAPLAYSQYWNALAVDQVRIAVRAIQSGNLPENVYPFKSDLFDSTPNVQSLVQELTPETQFLSDYKIAMGDHGYQVEIRPESGTKYTATANYYGESDWMISCCFRHD